MNRKVFVIPALCLGLSIPLASAIPPSLISQERPLLAPSEALHEMVKLRSQANSNEEERAKFTAELLARTSKVHLSAQEEVALAFVYYLVFQPDNADLLAKRNLDRDDLAGRLSWIIHDRMLFRAYQKNEEGRELIQQFRSKFSVVPEDLVYSGWMAFDNASVYAEAGEHQKAVAVLLEDLQTVPLDKPYFTFDALAYLYESFVKVGKQQEALSWMKKHRDALRSRLASAHFAAPSLVPADLSRFPHRAGVLHYFPFPGGLAEDDPKFDRERLMLNLSVLAARKLDQQIAAAEKGEKIPD
jgi:hypothetical protein